MVLGVKNLPAKAGDVRDVCREDPLEEEMATHRSVFAWEIPWTEEHIVDHESAYSLMNLKDIVLNETSQSQKDKYCVIPFIWGT